MSGLRTNSLCACRDRVFYQNGRNVKCLDLQTGREIWSVPSAVLRFVYEDNILCADGRNVTVLSAEDGRTLWSEPTLLTEVRDVFVAGGAVWVGGFKPFPQKRGPSWGPYFATQRDLASGKLLMHIEPDNPGHHHRCYQNKATDRYILGGRRGTEFIDLESGEVLWNSWARGVCKYGVMPCNGLLYTPPHACACYVTAKLIGFHALAPESDSRLTVNKPGESHIERGPAYEQAINQSPGVNRSDWPMYRRNAQRSGCTKISVPTKLRPLWQVKVSDKLTAPTAAGGKVFAASIDEHKICAIDAESGRSVWDFTAGARIDSPPTIYQGRAVFGCRDGYVYSLQASDGKLAWRLRTTPDGRRIVACGRLESASPIPGSVLARDGVIYCTAGRSSYLDGGINLFRLDSGTGRILSRTPIYSPDPETGSQPAQSAPAVMPGARADILTGDDDCIYLRDMVFDKHGVEQPEGKAHLLTLTGFLDDSWPHRSYWIFGNHCSVATGCSRRDKNLIYGRLLVFDDSKIYGYGRRQVHWSNQLQDGAYRLFAVDRSDGTKRWEKSVEIQVRAMILANDILFMAGPPADTIFSPQPPEDKQKALLIAVSASDGAELARYRLDSLPVFDGMAAAYGRLYLSMQDGNVVCMAGE